MKRIALLFLFIIIRLHSLAQEEWINREVTITCWGNNILALEADVYAYITDGKDPKCNGDFVRIINNSNTSFYYQASNSSVYTTGNSPTIRLTIGANTYFEEVKPKSNVLINIKEGVYFRKEDLKKLINLVINVKYKGVEYGTKTVSSQQWETLQESKNSYYDNSNPCSGIKTTGTMYAYWYVEQVISPNELEYYFASEIIGFDGDEKGYSIEDEENLRACVRSKFRALGFQYTDKQIKISVYRDNASKVEGNLNQFIKSTMDINGKQNFSTGQVYKVKVTRMSLFDR